jgi:hypothetical protein
MAGRPSDHKGDQLKSLKSLPHSYHPAPQASISATNGDHPPEGDLEVRHFNLTKELYRLRGLLKSRQGLPVGQVGHVRQQARELEAKIEILELALGASKVEALAEQRAEAPRSKHFLQAFYCAAKQQLPPELVGRLERAAAVSKEI